MPIVSFPIFATIMLAISPGSVRNTRVQTDSAGVLDLPLVEVPSRGATSGSTLAVILSGDGGWAAGDKAMAAALADSGVAVVGLDIPSYLRVQRTPDEAAADIARLLRHYLATWHKDRVILIGYSHGADIVPFVASRLPTDLRSRVGLVAMLGLEPRANFEFHFADLMTQVSRDDDLPVLPEVEKLRGTPLLCVEGVGETHSLCSSLPPSLARVESRPGGHRIPGREGRATADLILAAARSPAR
jgi:type IV secretory pathway VirJ component